MPLDPTKQARDAAEAIRKLNHATLTPKQPVPAPVISSTVQALEQLLIRLPQALDQLSGQLHRDQTNNAIRMDDGSDPAAAIARVRTSLADTAQALDAATENLRDAAGPLFNMGSR